MSVVLFLNISGLVCIIMGLSFHLGYLRKPIVYWTIFTSSIYAAVPLGIGLLFLSLGSRLPSQSMRGIFLTIAIVFSVIGIIFGLTMPQFLTPRWFRYLREEYDEFFILILLKDAAKDYVGWKERTKTIDGLASWADEVRRKTRTEET